MRLFEPLDINGMVIPNRVMVPAMVTHLCKEDGFVTDGTVERYARYARGGAGLIIVEAMAVHHAKSGPLLRISDDAYIPGLRRIARAVHEVSPSKVVPQIIHFLKVARSGWRQTVDMVAGEDIELIVEQFGDAERRAREAGFDGAELHAAHAYTLASFLSRANPRADEYGRTLEGRLRLIGRVMQNVRRKAGRDFPVGIRIDVEEFIRDGYTVDESERIALRLGELGFDYVSLSAGGKFEDAVHKPGQVLFPYSGYSGERAMPGHWYPAALNAGLAARVKAHLKANGCATPLAVAGKLSEPADAERVLVQGAADIVAIARGLLADPDWPRKIERGEADRVVRCDYCNVCKNLDGMHGVVVCALWPQGATQAPEDDPAAAAPRWDAARGELKAATAPGGVVLDWRKAAGAAHYDVYRQDEDGGLRMLDAVKATRWTDPGVLGGQRYRYYVRPCAATGRAGPPSNTAVVEIAKPEYMTG
jgi:2,4-dienoyl-CoA reductase-like NADH-dependent reductase (Old Yellow Enzyme family)